ncbi:DNA topoisomerase [Streptobacillus moniliformis]|uniref:DNA topoisomerase n=1 Tax=Streptobacillus moniliformis TaxID=34105 RepID=UPI0007E46C60|nr:DNA topoisomerase [Streptobacillus moniliformis]
MIIKVDEEEFKLKGFVVKQLGFMKYEPKEYKDKLPNLNLNDEFDVEFKELEKETTPPAKVNESEISKFLKNPFKKEKNATEEEIYKDILEGIEIGTEATRTGIIDKCIRIGYLTLDKGVFDITEYGIFFIDRLIEYNINLFKEKSVEFSKLQKKVYKNEINLEEVIEKVEYELKDIVERTKHIEMPGVERFSREIKGVVEINTKNGKCYKGLFNNEEIWLYPNMKYFDNNLKITKSIAEKLCKGNYVEFELDYKGKKYMQKLKIEKNERYINFVK